MIELMDPEELLNHPLNTAIYGDTPDPELVASVKRYGVFPDHPIGYVHTADGLTIVSGHRRRQSARIGRAQGSERCKLVPCVRLHDTASD